MSLLVLSLAAVSAFAPSTSQFRQPIRLRAQLFTEKGKPLAYPRAYLDKGAPAIFTRAGTRVTKRNIHKYVSSDDVPNRRPSGRRDFGRRGRRDIGKTYTTEEGGEAFAHTAGSSGHKLNTSWKQFWLDTTRRAWPQRCFCQHCVNPPTVGAHILIPKFSTNGVLIAPMCRQCNANFDFNWEGRGDYQGRLKGGRTLATVHDAYVRGGRGYNTYNLGS